VIRALFACSVLAFGCADPTPSGHSLALRDPLDLIDDVVGPLRLLAFPTGEYTCDRATGIVTGPDGPLPDAPSIGDSVVDITFEPGGAASDRTVNVPPGSYELVVRGRGTDPVSMVPDTVIASGCATEAIASGETRQIEIELRPVFGMGVCGDPTLSPDEQCEDMNITAGDGCDPTCRSEPFAGARRGDAVVAAETLPAVAWAPGTRVGLVYDAGDEDGRDVREMLLTEAAAYLTAPVALSVDGPVDLRAGIQTQPAIALGGNRFGIALTDFGAGGDGEVRVVFTDVDRNPRGASTRVTATSDGGQTEPAIALAADGTALVVFVDTASATGLSGRVYAAGMTEPSGAMEFPVGTGAVGAGSPAITALPSGFLVAFSAAGVVRYQRFAADGTPTDAESRSIGTEAGRDQVAVAALPDGLALVAWRDASGDGAESAIRAAVIDATGMAGMPFVVNSTTAGPQAEPTVAAGFDRFLVAWTSGGQIRARVLDRSGAPALNRERPPTSDDFLVASGSVLSPVAAAGGSNLAIVVYQDNAMDIGGDIRVRRYPLP
jgi:cysteine-rich repeat protein